jgi:hypothetical protein
MRKKLYSEKEHHDQYSSKFPGSGKCPVGLTHRSIMVADLV